MSHVTCRWCNGGVSLTQCLRSVFCRYRFYSVIPVWLVYKWAMPHMDDAMEGCLLHNASTSVSCKYRFNRIILVWPIKRVKPTWMSHRQYEWVMSQSHCQYEWVMSHMWMSFTRTNDAMEGGLWYVTWLMYTWLMSRNAIEGCLWYVTWLICTWLIYTWLIYALVMSHNAIEGCLWYVTCLTSERWCDSCINESCHVMQSKGASDMWHESFIHDSVIHESCHIMQSNGASDMWHDSCIHVSDAPPIA